MQAVAAPGRPVLSTHSDGVARVTQLAVSGLSAAERILSLGNVCCGCQNVCLLLLLPLLKSFCFRPMSQVKAARCLKRLLTGRLSSPVSSYPVFPGDETNYLRAQVGWAAPS